MIVLLELSRDFRIIYDVTRNANILAKTDTTKTYSIILITSKASYSMAYVAFITPTATTTIVYYCPIGSWSTLSCA